MKKVALTLIAQQLKDDDLKDGLHGMPRCLFRDGCFRYQELRDTFIQLDKNRDGTLRDSALFCMSQHIHPRRHVEASRRTEA